MAALIVGIGLFWLVPGLRRVTIGTDMAALKTAAFGILAWVTIPMICVLITVTVVGIPVALIDCALWLLAVYLAKIVMANIIGTMLLSEREGIVMPLLVGLIVVMIAINLPWIGGIISALLTITGLGLIVEYVMRAWNDRRTAAQPA